MSFLYLRCSVHASTPEKALSSVIRSDIHFRNPKKQDGALTFEAGVFSRSAVKRWARDEGFTVSLGFGGVLSHVFALKQRLGIIFGTITALFLIYLSTFYVWSVRIEGNENLTDSEIVRLLRECGFSEGIKKKSVDVNDIQNTALQRCHELSFLSINIHGMVADVIVRERITSPKAIDSTAPYNLIADTDGVIVSSIILDGQTLFKTGDTVCKGQLLVSGLVDSTSGISNVRHARGKVYARTSRALSLEVPLTQIKRTQTSTETINGIRILGKSFYRKPQDTSGNYDVTTTEKEITFLGLSLPIKRETRQVSYYTEELVTLSDEDAEAQAFEDYRLYVSTELDSAEIIDEVFSVEKKNDSIILTAEVSAIENIATEKKFTVE